MAPTEILAEQHYRKLAHWLAGLPVEIAWLTGGLPAKARRKALEAIGSGQAMLAIGTHALFEEEVALPKLGLAIVDEQHRFGVAQRLRLRGKAMGEAHQLMMTATPIPRTLAMTFYARPRRVAARRDAAGPVAGDDASRQRQAASRRSSSGSAPRCRQGRQAYWVCPLIEESEKLELQTAVALHAELTAALPGLEVGLLHGRMKADEKSAVMDRFVAARSPSSSRRRSSRSASTCRTRR